MCIDFLQLVQGNDLYNDLCIEFDN